MNSQTKLKLLKAGLYIGAAYYLVGAFVHYFGLTLFPWFEGKLYVQYQDTIIALVAVILAYFLVVVARDPIKNLDMLKAIIVSAFIASIFSILIIWKIDFLSLGAPAKKLQTITEGILGLIFVSALIWLYPKKYLN
ncbi:MAG: hypothetical protein A3B99_03560 [Candidatus Yanofskybacteria bacterium RIFCSPHIGHO2_02_FULL_44_12b]|uniref:Uncharacterized protein n=1 Tax=Candidatus Yanofskybacteria bacterium RIFCSPLOWO2_01_FULL_44_22 TaxID=1802697 RepID=A0A1F8GML8_9BACT|nr:MAG: hypothetical protein A2659_01280 [Candidatus Yanofskybacteria bacterium RIFCSPHIGHO2_01_FULL_44_24]OGN15599.1 MAG: hypothetical protein A3B99_03560 [Candidatus Yanofskybacteria bacterium RIFCSPHIGHO2_02_FULL_44_12b]OGN26654.1 MAG: hypothetical protein A2925_03645 [Candidatus Yanofskybacteria bacterium RIFCSPLOWO2_01_FULL_44_22]